MSYLSDLPLRLNHRGMNVTIDFYVIVAGRVVNGGKMILYSTLPLHDEWTDVTEDHPVDGNVKELAIV